MGSRILTAADYHDMASQAELEWVGVNIPRNCGIKTDWICKKGHSILIAYTSIQSGGGCKYCNKVTILKRVKKEVKKKHVDYAKRVGFSWDETQEPASMGVKTYWLCPKGHTVHKALSRLLQNSICVGCGGSGKRPKVAEDYHILADKVGLYWLREVAPRNISEKTEWGCDKNHKWMTAYRNIRDGTRCPYCQRKVYFMEDYHGLSADNGYTFLGKTKPTNIQENTYWMCVECKQVRFTSLLTLMRVPNCKQCRINKKFKEYTSRKGMK